MSSELNKHLETHNYFCLKYKQPNTEDRDFLDK